MTSLSCILNSSGYMSNIYNLLTVPIKVRFPPQPSNSLGLNALPDIVVASNGQVEDGGQIPGFMLSLNDNEQNEIVSTNWKGENKISGGFSRDTKDRPYGIENDIEMAMYEKQNKVACSDITAAPALSSFVEELPLPPRNFVKTRVHGAGFEPPKSWMTTESGVGKSMIGEDSSGSRISKDWSFESFDRIGGRTSRIQHEKVCSVCFNEVRECTCKDAARVSFTRRLSESDLRPRRRQQQQPLIDQNRTSSNGCTFASIWSAGMEAIGRAGRWMSKTPIGRSACILPD